MVLPLRLPVPGMAYAEERVVRWTEAVPEAVAEPAGSRRAAQRQVRLEPESRVPHKFIDAHCHLDLLFRRDGNATTLSEYMATASVAFPPAFGGCLAVFCHPATWTHAAAWMRILEDPRVYGAFGCHPHRAYEWDSHKETLLKQTLRSHPRLLAVGEMGLDFSRNNHVRGEVQREVFQR